MRKVISVLACTAILGMAGSAMAYQFNLGADSTITGDALSDPGLVLQYWINPDLDSISFNLMPGESYSFLFAKIWTEESSVQDDDQVAQSIQANIDFELPDQFGYVPGTSDGFKVFWGFVQGWEIEWADPVYVKFGYQDSGEFKITLKDVSEWGLLGLNDDKAKVYANIELITEPGYEPIPDPAPIPEPASMLLYGAGIAGLAAIRRRKSSK